MTEEQGRRYLKDHELRGDVLSFDLAERVAELRGVMGERERSGATLVKEGGLTVVLTALRAGGRLGEHHAHATALLMVVDGKVRLTAGGKATDIAPGKLVAVDASVPHDVEALEPSAVLLTIVSKAAAVPGASA